MGKLTYFVLLTYQNLFIWNAALQPILCQHLEYRKLLFWNTRYLFNCVSAQVCQNYKSLACYKFKVDVEISSNIDQV